MNNCLVFVLIAVLLFVLELVYFKLADKYNIIDKPNQRSSHTRIVLRGGGIIFTVALWIWSFIFGFQYPLLLVGVTLAAGLWMTSTHYQIRCASWCNLYQHY